MFDKSLIPSDSDGDSRLYWYLYRCQLYLQVLKIEENLVPNADLTRPRAARVGGRGRGLDGRSLLHPRSCGHPRHRKCAIRTIGSTVLSVTELLRVPAEGCERRQAWQGYFTPKMTVSANGGRKILFAISPAESLPFTSVTEVLFHPKERRDTPA